MNDQQNPDKLDAQYLAEEDHTTFREMLDAYDSKLQEGTIEVGDRVRGTVLKIGEEVAFVDFGGRSEAVIETRELLDDEGELKYATGDEMEAFIVSLEEGVRLTLSIRSSTKSPELLRQAYKAGIPIEGHVIGANEGGFEVDLKGVRGFCPISQIDTQYCEDPDPFIGRTLTFRIMEYREQGRHLVLSRRMHIEEEEKRRVTALRAQLKIGVELTGTVTRIQPFGAFVDLGGIEGLVHVSELSYARVQHPREVVTEGSTLKVKVIEVKNLGEKRERIALSIKATQPDPWENVLEQFPEGSIVTGTVVSVQDFGAFVSLVPGIEGLVHVSELSERPIGHPRSVVDVGQQVTVQVLRIDPYRRRIALSRKAMERAALSKEAELYQAHREKAQYGTGAMAEALRRAGLI